MPLESLAVLDAMPLVLLALICIMPLRKLLGPDIRACICSHTKSLYRGPDLSQSKQATSPKSRVASLQPRLAQQDQSSTKATRANFAPALKSSEACVLYFVPSRKP